MVIVYKYERNLNPSPPPPVIIPLTTVQKFKHLIERLKQNFQQADKIIAEYLRDVSHRATHLADTTYCI